MTVPYCSAMESATVVVANRHKVYVRVNRDEKVVCCVAVVRLSLKKGGAPQRYDTNNTKVYDAEYDYYYCCYYCYYYESILL